MGKNKNKFKRRRTEDIASQQSVSAIEEGLKAQRLKANTISNTTHFSNNVTSNPAHMPGYCFDPVTNRYFRENSNQQLINGEFGRNSSRAFSSTEEVSSGLLQSEIHQIPFNPLLEYLRNKEIYRDSYQRSARQRSAILTRRMGIVALEKSNLQEHNNNLIDASYHYSFGLAEASTSSVVFRERNRSNRMASWLPLLGNCTVTTVRWSPCSRKPLLAVLCTSLTNPDSRIYYVEPLIEEHLPDVRYQRGAVKFPHATAINWNIDGDGLYLCTEKGIYSSLPSIQRSFLAYKPLKVPVITENSSISGNNGLLIGHRNGSLTLVDLRCPSNSYPQSATIGSMRYCIDHLQQFEYSDYKFCAQDLAGSLAIFDVRAPGLPYKTLTDGNFSIAQKRRFWLSEEDEVVFSSVITNSTIGNKYLHHNLHVYSINDSFTTIGQPIPFVRTQIRNNFSESCIKFGTVAGKKIDLNDNPWNGLYGIISGHADIVQNLYVRRESNSHVMAVDNSFDTGVLRKSATFKLEFQKNSI